MADRTRRFCGASFVGAPDLQDQTKELRWKRAIERRSKMGSRKLKPGVSGE
jgi:hypothetical protein